MNRRENGADAAHDFLVAESRCNIIRANEKNDHFGMNLIQGAILNPPQHILDPIAAYAQIDGMILAKFFFKQWHRPARGDRVAEEDEFRFESAQLLALQFVLFRKRRFYFPVRSNLWG